MNTASNPEFSWPHDRMYRPVRSTRDQEGSGVAAVAMDLFCVAAGSSDGAAHGIEDRKRRARWLRWRLDTWCPSSRNTKVVEDALRAYCEACLSYATAHDPVLSRGD